MICNLYRKKRKGHFCFYLTDLDMYWILRIIHLMYLLLRVFVSQALNLLPSNVQPTDRGADAIKAVLGNLRAIPTKLAEIRNPFGSGHGKSASFQGLEVRHAKLAVGSSITFVDFIWSTYENQNLDKLEG